ncbi:double-stranded RNA-binding protein 6-like isoform X2 [Malania oleifera]|uniref:double-stranded RNA-binding protein 6-like isoform X2 n=1 Tax=Malania oleifera TaxID=397392 RepID=UPI0025AE61F8|nr:double-stranded RNA-binding protein 6-like isoform X2 [Malania oleifera]
MYKNQLQELAQRSCFNLPSYTSIREGPDHAPRFKAIVNFNGETFHCPHFCTTLRQAEHSAAEVALTALSKRAPSHSLAARILEISQRVGASLPIYTNFRSGRLPTFTCTVELAGVTFTGEPAKNKKQAEKNAAVAAWSSLKQLAQQTECSSSELRNGDEQEYITIARALQNYRVRENVANQSFPVKFPAMEIQKPQNVQPPPVTASKILPLIQLKGAPRSKPTTSTTNDTSRRPSLASPRVQPQKFAAAAVASYVPCGHVRASYGVAPPVTIRNVIPVFSAPPLLSQPPKLRRPQSSSIPPPVFVRQAVLGFSTPRVQTEDPRAFMAPRIPPSGSSAEVGETTSADQAMNLPESTLHQELEELKI